MILFTTVDYSDIYSDPKPCKEELLNGIPSQLLIKILSVINTELSTSQDVNDVQLRMMHFIGQRFSPQERERLKYALDIFQKKHNTTPIIWGKRYVLEFIKYEFLNYRPNGDRELTPHHELNIFKAYLLIAEEVNERERIELDKMKAKFLQGAEYLHEQVVWPILLNQFNVNNEVNPISQFIRLLAFLRYSINDPELLDSWKKFLSYNGFESLNKYLAGVHFLIKITLNRKDDGSFLKSFTTITASDLPKHLLNLSFDVNEFNFNKEKQIDFKGLKEKPLFRSADNEFVILDIDFLNNKIYNGPLFDIYYKTDMAANTRFKTFPDFKTHISTFVSENIVFRGVIKKLFKKKNVVLFFDDNNIPNCPDCYIRFGNRIFLIEFKDYLFPGKLVEEFSFEKIKAHIDTKFIKNQNSSNKGISQIIEQIRLLSTTKFNFDRFQNRNITVYPLIVHTNFTYQLPGVNYYLQSEFNKRLQSELPNLQLRIENLTLVDLETLFKFLYLKEIDLKIFENFLNRYNRILKNRTTKFELSPSQENFLKARTSFDEIYQTILYKETQIQHSANIVSIMLETIGADEKLLHAF